jgi:hypothetical protein
MGDGRAKLIKGGDSRYAEIRQEYNETPHEFLPFGIDWTFTLNGREVFTIPATFPSPVRVERDRRTAHARPGGVQPAQPGTA